MFAGLLILAAAALGVASHVWLSRSVLVPMAGERIEYLFVSATSRSLLAIASVTALLMLVAHLLIRRDAARHGVQPPLFSWADTAYLAPLCWFAVTPLALLNLIPSVSRFFSVASYAIVDLRWWWTVLVVGWVAWRVDARSNGAWRRHLRPLDHLRPPHRATSVPAGGTEVGGIDFARRRRWFREGSLVVLAAAWAVAGTPVLRSSGGAIGDEPKYLRYCELWYQGLGFEISQIKPMSELPDGFQPRLLQNFARLAQAVPGELRSLLSDAALFIHDPAHQFNRARHIGGGFVAGKDGGMYQMHNPGISFAMFPAYYLDRQFARVVPGSKAQWPDHLPIVNALMVGVYAAWTVLIFRFLRKCGASDGVAWIVALTSTFTLPAAAFPLQYYPELVAGLSVTAIAGHVLFTGSSKRHVSFAYGLLAGYLPWLHVRFSAVTIAFLFAAALIWRSDRRRTMAFAGGLVVAVVLFSLYTYQISGSVMPSALWTAGGDENNFAWLSMIRNSAAYLVDRDWGLFAHSPVFLLALPGYWWMARRQPAVAWLSAALFLALLLPAAGKTLIQTTPMRLIVAVVPIGATPLIDVLSRRSRWTLVLFALLLILSLDNALAYNFHHDRVMDILVDSSFSGWKVNMLFPYQSRQPWQVSAANGALLVFWLAAIGALLTAPWWMNRWRPRASDAPRFSLGPLAVMAAAIFIALGTAVSAATGAWTWHKYLMVPRDAARQAALLLDDLGRCAICYSSEDGPIGRRDAIVGAQRLMMHLESVDPSVATRREDSRLPGYADWLEMPGRIRAWYSEVNGREPTSGELGHFLYQWREERVPPSEIRRRIFAAAGKTPP